MDTLPANQTSESRDGVGAGDRDIAYAWDNPRQYLTIMCQARLTVMRGLVMDFRRGERGGAADGDLWLTTLAEAVPIVLPVVTEPEPNPDEGDFCGG